MNDPQKGREAAVEFVKKVLVEIERLANEYPGAVYVRPYGFNRCSYVVGGFTGEGKLPTTCGCIVGQAIRNVDPKLGAWLEQPEFRTMNAIDMFWNLLEEHFATSYADDEVPDTTQRMRTQMINLIESVQGLQDGGHSWRKAIAHTKSFYDLPEDQSLVESYSLVTYEEED